MMRCVDERAGSTKEELGISIIVPIYFSEMSAERMFFFRRALESVAEQRFAAPFEILVVDDSPRPIAEVSKVLGEDLVSDIRWVRPPRNNGLVAALNTGVREAKYPLIARLDADDRWCPGKIEKQMALLSQDPDLSIVATGMSLVDPQGNVFQRLIRPGDWTGILRFFVEVGCPFPHGSIIARKDIFRLLGGYPHEPITAHCEDFALWGTWLRFFKPAMVEEVLYEYTVSPTAKSAVNKDALAHATSIVIGNFARLHLTERLPDALSQLARVLGITILQSGVLTYRMWHHRVSVHLPEEAIVPLRTILCDREIYDDDDLPALDLSEALRGFLVAEAASRLRGSRRNAACTAEDTKARGRLNEFRAVHVH